MLIAFSYRTFYVILSHKKHPKQAHQMNAHDLGC